MDHTAHSLTSAIASGDTEAFGRFYDLWFDRVRLEAARISGRDESFCLDIVQDSMLRVIKHIKPLPDDEAIHAWLRVVVRSVVYDRFRSENRRRARHEQVAAGRRLSGATTDDLADRLAWLESELQLLSASDQKLILMRHRFGWTLQRIADTLGLSPGAVDGRVRRITSRLRRNAEEVLDDE